MDMSLLDEGKQLLGHGIVVSIDTTGLHIHGNFNGVRLSNIPSKQVTLTEGGKTLFSFRVMEFPDDLEPKLRLGASALLILSDETIEGALVHYGANVQTGFEITIEYPTR